MWKLKEEILNNLIISCENYKKENEENSKLSKLINDDIRKKVF